MSIIKVGKYKFRTLGEKDYYDTDKFSDSKSFLYTTTNKLSEITVFLDANGISIMANIFKDYYNLKEGIHVYTFEFNIQYKKYKQYLYISNCIIKDLPPLNNTIKLISYLNKLTKNKMIKYQSI